MPFLQKPFTPDVLAERIRELLDGAPAASSPGGSSAS
jgi:DNA-binding response OmpR family regulator